MHRSEQLLASTSGYFEANLPAGVRGIKTASRFAGLLAVPKPEVDAWAQFNTDLHTDAEAHEAFVVALHIDDVPIDPPQDAVELKSSLDLPDSARLSRQVAQAPGLGALIIYRAWHEVS